MGGSLRGGVGGRGVASGHRPLCEALEGRRLLTITLSLSGGVLNVQESVSGLSNFTIIQVVNGSQLQISDSTDTIIQTSDVSALGWHNTGDQHTFAGPEAGISSVVLDTFDGGDDVNILSTNLPILVQPRGAASETLEVGDFQSPTGAQAITGAVTFDGTNATFASIDVDDRLDSGNVDPTLTSTSLLNFAPAPINFTAPPRGSSPNPTLIVAPFAGTGTSGFVLDQDPNNPTAIDYQIDCDGRGTVGVEHLNANSRLIVAGDNGGSELVRLGSLGQISGVLGQVIAEGNTGTASAVVNDSNDAVAHTFATRSNGVVMTVTEDGRQVLEMDQPCTALTLQTGTAANTVNLDLASFGSGFTTTLDSGGTNDAVNVTSLQSGANLNVVGGAGVDNVSARAASVQGTMNISNPTGLEAVSIDGSATSSPQVISVSGSRVTGLGTGTYGLANLASLSVVGGSAFDNFSVTPSTSVPVTLDGGPNTGTASDRLDVSTSQVTGTSLSLTTDAAGNSGTYTFANRQPIRFTRFATITPTFGDVTGTVYNEQTGLPVAGATVIVDKNGNGAADAGEPTATTDAAGAFAFSGLPTGTFSLLVNESGFQNLSAFVLTVTAGTLGAPLQVPIVPAPAAGGPDLVAAVVASAPGRAGSIRPRAQVKVTNVGAAMTSAAAIEIALFASPDATLDSTDASLLTTTTAPLLLKARQSRVFTLTGSTAASLTRGSYYLLASVDAGNTVAEASEANNVAASARPVTLAPPLADLSGKFGALPRTANASRVLSVPFVIQNLGTIPAAGTIDFDFFASTDTTLDGSDPSLGTSFPVAAHVAPGGAQAAVFKLSISSLPAGTYYLVAKVNSGSSLSESDLTNNLVFSRTPIKIA